MLTLAHVKNTHESEQIGLVLMAEQMSENLSGYDYFSNLIIDGNRIDIPIAEHANLPVESHPPISVMTLDLELKFQQPLDIVGKKVTWSVFDPTYYIAMNHKSVGDISITNTGNAECGKELFIPTALAETIAYADSLDKSQRNTDGLGNKFAERVYVTCL